MTELEAVEYGTWIGMAIGAYLVGLFTPYIWRRLGETDKRQDWRLYAYGGGAAIPITTQSKQEAIDYCAKHHGAVMHIDEINLMIFYKPFGYLPGGI